MELLVQQTHNLSNYFLLPFIKRASKDFAAGIFINSYLDIETFHLVVEVEQLLVHYKDFTGFDFTVEKGTRVFIFYYIPLIFHDDVGRFVDGKYSKFSQLAKTHIKKYGKLPFKQLYGGEVEKSVWLHVIDKTDKLKETLEQQLGVTIGEYDELASKPDKNNFFHNI